MAASTRGAAATTARRRATTPPPHVIAAELPPERPYHESVIALLAHLVDDVHPDDAQPMVELLMERLITVTELPREAYPRVATAIREMADRSKCRVLLIRAAELLEARHHKHIE